MRAFVINLVGRYEHEVAKKIVYKPFTDHFVIIFD